MRDPHRRGSRRVRPCRLARLVRDAVRLQRSLAAALVATASVIALPSGYARARPLAMAQVTGQVTISVPGVPGPYCVYGIEKRLMELPEVAAVRVLWDGDEIRVVLAPGARASRALIESAIDRAEYAYPYSIDL